MEENGGGGGLVAKLCPTLAIPWTIACQAPLSLGFSRQEYWSGLPFPFPGDLPDPGIKPRSPALQADHLPTELGASHSSREKMVPDIIRNVGRDQVTYGTVGYRCYSYCSEVHCRL